MTLPKKRQAAVRRIPPLPGSGDGPSFREISISKSSAILSWTTPFAKSLRLWRGQDVKAAAQIPSSRHAPDVQNNKHQSSPSHVAQAQAALDGSNYKRLTQYRLADVILSAVSRLLCWLPHLRSALIFVAFPLAVLALAAVLVHTLTELEYQKPAMRISQAYTIASSLAACAAAGVHSPRQPQQHVMMRPDPVQSAQGSRETGVGHFSEWSRENKRQFLLDWEAGRTEDWVLILGNEGGDLDSMAAALTWAYHLHHTTQDTAHPVKAMALLQTPADALDLRPENILALDNSQMSPGHSDLLTLNELPEDPETLSNRIKGIVMVDHPVPLRKWDNAEILSIFDHHNDKGVAPDAQPRVFEKVASCTTLVARQMLDELERLDEEYHVPHELLELILAAIAIDSGGLRDAAEEDRRVSERILKRSNWRGQDLDETMEDLGDELRAAKKDLDDLTVRDLLRRDWKGDLVDTPSPRTPTVSLGFSSIPYSLDDQIERTEFGELFHWFAIEAAWTAQVGADISVALNKYKIRDENGKKRKIREIVLCVRSDVRIDEEQADSLFRTVSQAIERDRTLNVKPWHRAAELGRRQMVWTHEQADAGRKVIRPIIDAAVHAWDM